MEESLDMQKLNYFITDGHSFNEFTGSKTKNRSRGVLLRYLVKPVPEAQKLCAFCWTEDVCFAKASDKQEMEASMNEQGLEEIRGWLAEQYDLLP